MYIPPIKGLRATDPVSRARAAYTTTSYPGTTPGRTTLARDRFNLSDEARLREEYSLRLTHEGRRKRGKREPALPTLPEMARLYAMFDDEIRQNFRNHVGELVAHSQALDFAWRDALDNLARAAAERLARRESDPRAANMALLAEIIGDAHRKFADTFCSTRQLSGAERAIPAALRDAVGAMTLVQNYELSLSDTMALLYYRKGLEKQR